MVAIRRLLMKEKHVCTIQLSGGRRVCVYKKLKIKSARKGYMEEKRLGKTGIDNSILTLSIINSMCRSILVRSN